MSLSFDVSLERHMVPRWPDACVRCCAIPATEAIEFSTHRIGWLNTLTMSLGEKASKVRVPTCSTCVSTIVSRRRLRRAFEFGAVALVLAILYLTGQVNSMPRWLFVATAFSPLVPLALLRVFIAPVFDFTVMKETIDYEFRSEGYADRFYALNYHAVQ